jgi:hypothetical protein
MEIGKVNHQQLTSGVKVKKQAQETSGDAVSLNTSKEQVPEGVQKKWLFMNYIAADCNLKEFQEANVTNQQLVGSDANTHIVDMIDVGHGTDPMTNSWSGCKTFYVTKGTDDSKITSPMIEDHGINVDMSNPATLTKFIIDTVKKFPADNIALILNDHGGGFTGALADDSDGGFMSTPQLKQALADAEKVTGKKIDIVGFDACLMAETEVAHALKDNAKILLASEESEGGPGWTYQGMLNKGGGMTEAIDKLQGALDKKITVDPKQFAQIVVKENEAHQGDISTFSATDLTKMDAITKSVDTLAQAIIGSSEKAAVKSAITKADHFGGGYNPYKDLRDLHNVAKNISGSVKDKNLKAAADAVVKNLEDAILANEANPSRYPNSKGMSIFAPTNAPSGPGYKYGDLPFAKETKWVDALKELGKVTGGGGGHYVDDGNTFAAPQDTPDVWPDGSQRKA